MNLLHLAFEHSPDVLLIAQEEEDGGFRYLKVNHAFETMTGFTRHQAEGVRIDDLLPREGAERLTKQYRRCLDAGDTVEFEQPFAVPSGQRTWHVRLRPMGSCTPPLLIAAARDITWSRNFAQQLETVAAYIPGFVYQLCLTPDGGWRYSFVGERAEKMFGVSAQEALENAEALMKRIHPDDRERVTRERLHSADHLTPWHSEFRVRHRDEHTLWVEAHGLPQRLEDGTILWTGYVNDITERKTLEDSLQESVIRFRQLARTDPLTGLANRGEFFARLENAMNLAARQGQSMALLFIDLDRFKPVNDTYGHVAGDQLLRDVGERLCRRLRDTDLVARIGGDEFTVLMPGPISAQAATRVAEQLCSILAAPFHLADDEVTISASIGVAIYPEHGKNAEALTHAADQAMYRAKSAGRNTVRLYRRDTDAS
ncbi:MAG: diguanylate cyclase [Halomonas sp.]|uniref:sensor domain-containing protein n=1 Tax=Halomonas sp. TaxID=1486246 RepID=UPI00286FE7FD|nr:diguanylate cyclase [Halomonas sp.]MDR9440126.1 diguanylate cyclase [Halomonas sp.]